MDALHEASVFAMEAATPVALASRDHGPRHWHDVARIGHALATAQGTGMDLKVVDLEVVFLFAVLHDTQRVNEYDDPDHGNRAEDLLRIMRERGVVHLDNDQCDLLNHALGDHDRGYAHRDPTIGTCWDADRLTLDRVGIRPDPSFMSTRPVKRDFKQWLELARRTRESKDIPWSEIVSIYEGNADDPARQIPA